MREQTCCFIGHRECVALSPEKVKEAMEALIRRGAREFLCGGMGQFDWMCARLAWQKKQVYSDIHCDLILPYLSFRVREPGYFDNLVYPEELEGCHFKGAIVARNRWLVEQAAYALCYVTHDWGGAAKTYRYAKKKGLFLMNLGE